MDTIDEFVYSINQSNKLIIVEGKKDLIALRNINIKNKIITLSKKPLCLVCEDISKISKEVIIFTDFDKKGIEIYKKLNTYLQGFGIKIDKKYRGWLRKNTKISHIEGLNNHCIIK
jgi:5S rRNA maturation endonuclease (ribonuclease M5)